MVRIVPDIREWTLGSVPVLSLGEAIHVVHMVKAGKGSGKLLVGRFLRVLIRVDDVGD